MKTIRIAALLLTIGILRAQGDGLIIVPPENRPPPTGHFSFTPLEVKHHRVSVTIDDQLAKTSIDQVFHNPNPRRLEGTYLFPLPKGAHIDNFAMDVNGKRMAAELLNAEKARKLYEEIVRKAKDPALLEYVGRGAFKVRIFPIEPNADKAVSISYTEILKADNGMVRYIYPLNTEKFSAKPIKQVSVTLSLDTTRPIKSIYSPSHNIEVNRHNPTKATVGYEETDARPDTDFELIFSRHQRDIGIDLMTHHDNSERYFMAMISPGLVTDKQAVLPKDVCFVLDTSGSMMGDKLAQAKQALQFCLQNLNAQDRFQIVRFSTEAERVFDSLQPVTRKTVARASDFLKRLKPIGGTAIHEALQMAMQQKKAKQGDERPYHVVFLTDGIPTIGKTDEASIINSLTGAGQSTRVFSFGIGANVNTHLLDKIAERTRAVSQYVLPKEDLELKLSRFYKKIAEPILSNVAVNITEGDIKISKLYPRLLPDLFNGDQLIIFGTYSGTGAATLALRGAINGKEKAFTRTVTFSDQFKNRFIPAMWATRRVGWLLDEIRKNGENKELKDEITRLARQYGIVTPYTAYLILEDEAIRDVPVAQRNMRELSTDAEAKRQAADNYGSLQREASSVSSRSGMQALHNAIDLNRLKYSKNRKQMHAPRGLAKGKERKTDGYRTPRTYTQQVRTINGRTFFQNNGVWNDSTAQADPTLKQKKIVFNSKAYFELLRKNRTAAPWLSLGRRVDIVIDDTLYQVR